MAIAKLGQRIPLAYRYARMLEDLIIEDCAALQTFPQVQNLESHLLGTLEYAPAGSNLNENLHEPFLSLTQ